MTGKKRLVLHDGLRILITKMYYCHGNFGLYLLSIPQGHVQNKATTPLNYRPLPPTEQEASVLPSVSQLIALSYAFQSISVRFKASLIQLETKLQSFPSNLLEKRLQLWNKLPLQWCLYGNILHTNKTMTAILSVVMMGIPTPTHAADSLSFASLRECRVTER